MIEKQFWRFIDGSLVNQLYGIGLEMLGLKRKAEARVREAL